MDRPSSSGLLLVSLLCLSACQNDAEAHPSAEANPDPPAPRVYTAAPTLADLGDGYAVWESNRSGAWRIWFRAFDSDQPRQLTADEPGRSHCCPHVAPDGRSIAYLSLPKAAPYPEGGATGTLRVIGVDGTGGDGTRSEKTGDRVVLESARTYFEHRAAVWRDNGTLIAIRGDGKTIEVDPRSGRQRVLVDSPGPFGRGWLLDPGLRHATTGSPGFGRYDAATRQVTRGPPRPGCQPFVSADGRWGYWVAGAGGPIQVLDLADGTSRTLIAKSDSRLPSDRGYLYFPMLGRNADLMAWAASDGSHDHGRADYDVFVAETDADTLELVSAPIRVTADPATDRFPDVYLAPLGLGRHFGEAPFTLSLDAPVAGDWRWRIVGPRGDVTNETGASVTHTFEDPGGHRIEARLATTTHTGRAWVRPAGPPRVTGTEVVGPRAVHIRFDEAVDTDSASIRFVSGRAIESRMVVDDRTLALRLGTDFDGPDTLRIEGVMDRASSPNAMAPAEVEVRSPTWPGRDEGLVLLWPSARSTSSAGDTRGVFEAEGRAFTDRVGAMVLDGGTFLADMPTMESVLEGARATNTISVEMTITPYASPRPEPGDDAGHIFSFSGGRNRRNMTIQLSGDDLVLLVNTPETGRNAQPGIELGTLPRDRPSHVVIGYEPGRAVFYRDGTLVLDRAVATGGFFHWRPLALQIGDEWQEDQPWRGRLEGLAVYNRLLGADEVRENARRYDDLIASRTKPERTRIEAVLIETSTIPSLESIAPYEDALAVFAYRVERVVEGDYDADEVRAVHRVLSGGARLEAASRRPGTRVELVLEPFADHPELASLYRSETLPPKWELPLFYALSPVEQ